MKDNTSETSPTPKVVEPVGTRRATFEIDLVSAVENETPGTFETRAMKAQMHGHTYIEASADIIAFYNKDGLGNSKFFNFGNGNDRKGLRVFMAGTKEKSDVEEKLQLHQKLHGGVAFFEGRT